jgi:hypothetical protein
MESFEESRAPHSALDHDQNSYQHNDVLTSGFWGSLTAECQIYMPLVLKR